MFKKEVKTSKENSIEKIWSKVEQYIHSQIW